VTISTDQADKQLEEMVRSHWRVLAAVLKSRFPADLAEPALSEAFIAALKFLRDGGEMKAERAWLYTCARRHMIDLLRRYNRETPGYVAPDSIAADCEQPFEKLVQQELRQELQEALLKIPPRERQAVILRHFYGLSVDETAQVMDISPNSIGPYTRSALDKLQTIMHEHGGSPEEEGR
jgi:RNA polymerase sigma factor (sigma-70 family)